MEYTEFIKLNGKEYELTLNRDSFVRIDRICNINDIMYQGNKPTYETLNEISDDYNPDEDISMDGILKTEEERLEKLKKLVTLSLFIMLHPKNKFKPSEVKEMLNPYWENSKKTEKLCNKVGTLLEKCVKLKDNAIKDFEEKNLKAQTK